MKQERIYLDWNATAPLLPQVREAMVRAMDRTVGNASSIHHEGQRARSVIERARRAVARALGTPAQSVVFTAGATEGNNQILRTHVQYHENAHLVCSRVEHPSVLEVVEALGEEGRARVSFLEVDKMGRLDLEQLERLCAQESVTLVSVMWANNETGVILPVEEVRRITKEHDVLLHVDATQALGRIAIDATALDADFMTLSFHKMGGPKGVGAIVTREGITLESMLAGGHQERGRRPGTENVIAIAGAEAAAKQVAASQAVWTQELERKRALLLEALQELGVSFELRGDPEARLANTLNLAFEIPGEDLLLALDLEGVSASSGSACTAGSLEPSHVVLAMGYGVEEAKRSVRLSFGPTTPDSDLMDVCVRLDRILKRLERIG